MEDKEVIRKGVIICTFFITILAVNNLHCQSQGFVENKGQFQGDIRYCAFLDGLNVIAMEDRLVIQSYNAADIPAEQKIPAAEQQPGIPARAYVENTAIVFLTENKNACEIIPCSGYETRLNYFKGSNPEKWAKNVHAYNQIRYKDIFPGVDLDLDLADASHFIHWNYQNEEAIQKIKISVKEAGGTSRFFAGTEATERIEQIFSNKYPREITDNHPTESSSKLYSHPSLLYSSFFGGSLETRIMDIKLDSLDYIYMTGWTSSPDFPVTPGAYDTILNNDDIFLAKLDPQNHAIIYATFFGGSKGEAASKFQILDSLGLIAISGITISPDYPVILPAFQPVYGGNNDGCLSIFNLAGDSLLYSTFFGGTEDEFIDGLKKTNDLSLAFWGISYGDTPTTPNSYQPVFSSINPQGTNTDGFLARINLRLDSLRFSTYLGGIEPDILKDVISEPSGNYLLCGITRSDLPVTPGAYQSSYLGENDIFVARMSENGDSILNSTYFGTELNEVVYSIERLDNGVILIHGSTSSPDFPVLPGAYDTVFDSIELFVSSFNHSLTQLLSSTYMGTGGYIWNSSMNKSIDGNFLIYGSLKEPPLVPLTECAFDDITLLYEGFICKLSSGGDKLLYSSYLGGKMNDFIFTLRETSADTVLIAGWTYSPDYYTTPGCQDSVFNCPPGYSKGILTKLALSVYPKPGFDVSDTACFNDSTYFINKSDCSFAFKWHFGDGDSSVLTHPVHFYSQAGKYTVSLIASNAIGTDTLLKEIYIAPLYHLTVDTSICDGDSVFAGGMYRCLPGTYYDSLLSKSGCDSTIITILSVDSVPLIVLPEDTACCEGETVILDAGNPGAQFLWSNGATAQSIPLSIPGQYFVTVTNNSGCSAEAMVDLTVYPKPRVYLPDSAIICEGDILELDANGCAYCNYLWYNGDTLPAITVSGPGIYWVKASDGHCFSFDSLEVKTCTRFTVPNVFTPNGDGFNDLFMLKAGQAERCNMMIFNKWGGLVHKSEGPVVSWDGKINNEPCSEGTYYYVISWEGWGTGYRITRGNLTGPLMLIR